MRILYLVHQYFPHSIGGTEVYLEGLARRAKAQGDEPAIITYVESSSAVWNDFGIRRTQHAGVPVAEVHFNLATVTNRARAEFDHPAIGELVRAEIRRFCPDIIHVIHAMKLSGAAIEASLESGKPVVMTLADFWMLCLRHTLLKPTGNVCRGPVDGVDCVRCARATHGIAQTPWSRLPVWWEKFRLRRALARSARLAGAAGEEIPALDQRNAYLRGIFARLHAVIALSDFQRRILESNGFKNPNLRLLPHGIEPAALTGFLRKDRSSPRLVFIGSLVEHKGVHVLLEALRSVPDRGWECFIYGRVTDSEYVRRLQGLAGNDPRIHFAGTFPPEQLGEVLSEASALVLPALWYENDPLVIKAALHLGVPVLASRIGSLEEQVKDGVDGWLLPPGQVGAWAKAITQFVGEPHAMRPPGRPQKTMDEHAAALFELYRDLALHGAD